MQVHLLLLLVLIVLTVVCLSTSCSSKYTILLLVQDTQLLQGVQWRVHVCCIACWLCLCGAAGAAHTAAVVVGQVREVSNGKLIPWVKPFPPAQHSTTQVGYGLGYRH